MKATHEKATVERPIRGRQRLFLVAAGIFGTVVVVAVAVVIALAR